MKKIHIVLLCVLLALTLGFAASAAGETDAANALYALGLLKGYDDSGSDFRPEQGLTRAEAVVQIVRFLGAERKALENATPIPFNDVPAWAAPYVGYACENGIVSGRSATKFDPNGTVDEAQFLTLMLRAMGYSDKDGDFVWNDPFALANRTGLTDRTTAADSFTRGDAFVICKNALFSAGKSGKTLGEALTAAGVVTASALGYAKRIAGGECIVVACVGDSITEGHSSSDKSRFSYPAQLQKMLGKGYKVVNCGKSASYVMSPESTYNARADKPELWYPNTAEYKKLMRSNADIVVVMLGTNDARSMTAPEAENDFVKAYKALIADIQKLESKPEIYLSTMIPAISGFMVEQGTTESIPALIRSIGKDLNLPVIETGEALGDYYRVMLPYNDMVHPTDATYPALAIHFCNSIFGRHEVLPEPPEARGSVVYVSGAGKLSNGGTSPADAVDKLGTAVAMLRETGGTVVVCGPLTLKETYLVACAAPVTVTSVYGGTDYRTAAGAKLTISGNLQLSSDLVLENLALYSTVSAPNINCRYHNLTVGEGISWSASGANILPMSINAGTRVDSGTIDPAAVSCHTDCTVTINSGTWALVRGGNLRLNPYSVIGTVDRGAKVSVMINGGSFVYTGGSANAASGMNSCEGEIYMEINGGSFKGNVVGLHGLGNNQTGKTAVFSGALTMKITGGSFGNLALYHNAASPKLTGSAKLILTSTTAQYKGLADFDEVIILP